MLRLEGRVAGQDRLGSGTFAEAISLATLSKDDGDRNPGVFRAQLASADFRISAEIFPLIGHVSTVSNCCCWGRLAIC